MTDVVVCRTCGAALKPGGAFCSACGTRSAEPVSGALGVAIGLYLALLGVQLATMIAVRLDANRFDTLLVAEIGGAVVVVLFYRPARARLAELSARAGLRWYWYGAIVLAAVPIAAAIIGYVHGLATLVGIHPPSELDELAGHHIAWTIMMVVILPPLVEELAFRGVVYGALRKTMTVGEAMIVSSFAFALLHLSIPSLLTHMPLGLYFAWLRERTGSLWPGVFAHACHNALVVVAATAL